MSARRFATFISVAISILIVITAVPGLAGHETSGVLSYTGCLKAQGTLVDVAVGDSPAAPCGSKPVVHFSGGDITEVATAPGSGLTGGGTNGAVSLAIGSTYQLPQTCTNGQLTKWTGSLWACGIDNDTTYSAGTGLSLAGTTFALMGCSTDGQILKWDNDSSTWTCDTDQDSGGDITAVTAGTGLTGGGTSGAVSLAVDTSAIQSRVSGTCAAGSAIRVVNQDGTVTCESIPTASPGAQSTATSLSLLGFVSIGPTCTSLGSFPITLPPTTPAGLLLVTGRHTVNIAHFNGATDRGYLVWSSAAANCGLGDDTFRSYFTVPSAQPTVAGFPAYEQTLFSQSAFSVPAGGGTFTVFLNGQMLSGSSFGDVEGNDLVHIEFHTQ